MTTALLIIDVQKAILAGAGTPERQPVLDRALDVVVGRLHDLQEKARHAGVPVLQRVCDAHLVSPSLTALFAPVGSPAGLARKLLRWPHAGLSRSLTGVVGLSRAIVDLHRAAGLFAGVPTEVIPSALPVACVDGAAQFCGCGAVPASCPQSAGGVCSCATPGVCTAERRSRSGT